jgi:Terminase small subunit
MPILKNSRHERFAQMCASGKKGSAAYREVINANAKNPDVNADQLLNQPGVRERIEELKAASAQRCSMTREQFLESLVAMYQGKPGEATLDNELCDSLISRGVRHAVFPMKATIANQIAKLTGWDAPVKVEVDVSDKLSGLLDRVFGSGAEKQS